MAIAAENARIPEVYDVHEPVRPMRPCPMCGRECKLTTVRCPDCGELLPVRAAISPEPEDRRFSSGILLGLFGVLYHPVLLFLSAMLWPLLWIFGAGLLFIAGVAYLLFPVFSSLYVLFGDQPCHRYSLGARLLFSLGVLWLPVWIGMQFFLLGFSLC